MKLLSEIQYKAEERKRQVTTSQQVTIFQLPEVTQATSGGEYIFTIPDTQPVSIPVVLPTQIATTQPATVIAKVQQPSRPSSPSPSNFDEIALSRTVKEIEANLCFAIFGKNSKIQNGRHFWGGENFFENSLHSLDTLWVENFDEIALSRMVKEIEANLCFAIFGKNLKIQNGRHFWGGENFF